VKDSEVLVWNRDRIQELALRYPCLLENALTTASVYFEWYVTKHMLLISHSAPQRLAHVVLELANDVGHSTQEGIALDITNEELADAANITRYSTSRLLAEWQRNGVVTKRRNSVVLRSPDRLFSYSLQRRTMNA
jgi:CRP-like cAMP-binding protein